MSKRRRISSAQESFDQIEELTNEFDDKIKPDFDIKDVESLINLEPVEEKKLNYIYEEELVSEPEMLAAEAPSTSPRSASSLNLDPATRGSSSSGRS